MLHANPWIPVMPLRCVAIFLVQQLLKPERTIIIIQCEMHRSSHRTCFNWFLFQVHYLSLSCDVTFRRTSNIDLKFSSGRKSIIAVGKLFWWLITMPVESLWLVSCLSLSILCQIFLCDCLWDRGMFNSLFSHLCDNWWAA